MSGIEKITGRIEDDARQKGEAILETAREEAAGIARRYEDLAEKLRADLLAQGAAQAAQRAERLEAAGALEGRKAALETKQALVDRAFQLALQRLRDMPREEYTALLTDLLVRASATGREAVVFSPADRAQVGKAVVTAANERLKDGHLTLSGETREMSGGFVLADGPVEVNCTLETLVAQEKETLAGDVARALFPQG